MLYRLYPQMLLEITRPGSSWEGNCSTNWRHTFRKYFKKPGDCDALVDLLKHSYVLLKLTCTTALLPLLRSTFLLLKRKKVVHVETCRVVKTIKVSHCLEGMLMYTVHFYHNVRRINSLSEFLEMIWYFMKVDQKCHAMHFVGLSREYVCTMQQKYFRH